MVELLTNLSITINYGGCIHYHPPCFGVALRALTSPPHTV